MWKVVLVDDHPALRFGVRLALEKNHITKILGEYSNGKELLESLAKDDGPDPDLVIVDVSMPEVDGLKVLEALKRDRPRIKVLIYTMFTRSDLVKKLLDAGADAYVPKGGSLNQLFVAIESLEKGRKYLPTSSLTTVEDIPDAALLHMLTARQKQIAEAVAEGKENKEIAAELGLSVRTVEVHRSQIMKKLGARNLAALVRLIVDKDRIDGSLNE